jgi:AraC-like DNA-binding protein/mannose-6-phosphate isomerase-like protein (cupin superfamily)
MMNRPNREGKRELELRWASRFAGGRDVPWHTHKETELVAVTAGRCRIRVGQLALEGRRGSVFVLPANVAQYQDSPKTVRTTYLGFDLPPGSFDEQARVLQFSPSDPALAWLEQLCDGRQARPPLSRESVRALLGALLRRIGDMENGGEKRRHPALQRACEFLEARVAENPTLAETARAAGISVSHLNALFAARYGVGPMHFLQRLRMERACWLLGSPYLRVHEIAEACGYADENYFTRLFRKTFGMPPGIWRKRRVRTGKPV